MHRYLTRNYSYVSVRLRGVCAYCGGAQAVIKQARKYDTILTTNSREALPYRWMLPSGRIYPHAPIFSVGGCVYQAEHDYAIVGQPLNKLVIHPHPHAVWQYLGNNLA